MSKLIEQFKVRKKTGSGYLLLYIILFLGLILMPQMITIFFPGTEINVYLREVESEYIVDTGSEINLFKPIEINTVSSEELVEIGLDEDVARRWISYRKIINGFDDIEDVKNVYGLDNELFGLMQSCLYVEQNTSREIVDGKARSIGSSAQVDTEFPEIDWRPFNPNEVSKDDLMRLGLKEKTADTWLNYREVIGGFTTIEQVEKIYGLTDDWIAQAARYITFPEPIIDEPAIEKGEIERSPINLPESIDVNTAGVEEWLVFPEIDSNMAVRIVNFRSSINGFKDLDKLQETYGLKGDFVEEYGDILKVDEKTRIQVGVDLEFLNLAEEVDLARHPSISYKQARHIVKYREQHGLFSSTDELRRLRGLSTDWVNRIIELSDRAGVEMLAQEN